MIRHALRFLSLPLFMAVVVCAGCNGGDGAVAAQGAGRGGGGGRGSGGGGRGAGAQGPVPVTVGVVEQRDMPLVIRAIGTAQAHSVVAVHAQITGELTSVNFKEGDDIREGQTLFTLDRRPLEAALQQAEANLARDTAQAANAHSSAQRYQDLLARGIATKEQADQSTTSATALDATLGADRAAIENAKVQLQYATIKAPLSGRTGALMVHAGNLVRANDTTPLVVINQVTPIYVTFGIPESQLPDLKHYLARGGVKVAASAPAEPERSTGRITFIDNGVDPTTGTITVKGEFTNQDRKLWPGQFVNVLVTLTTESNAVVVPTAAVQNGQQGQYVFVVKPDKTVDFRPVTIERTAESTVIIKDGVKPGETVVTDGHLRLVAGSRISVKPAPGA